MQVIGYIMYRYTELGYEPKLEPSVDDYCLRMVEDDGEADMDFPALERKQPISKFGFEQLALCDEPRQAPRGSDSGAAGGGSREALEKTFVRIHLPTQGCSILNIKSNSMTLEQILALVVKKRALLKGQHTLELVDSPGMELDLSQTLQQAGVRDFNLIHKFSTLRRRDRCRPRRRAAPAQRLADGWPTCRARLMGVLCVQVSGATYRRIRSRTVARMCRCR